MTYAAFLKILKQKKFFYSKNKDRLVISNYRPVTIAYSISKIFEYTLLKRPMTFLKECNILSNNQHGFNMGLDYKSQRPQHFIIL